MIACDIHPFQRAGLGIAPFHFLRMEERVHIQPGCVPRAGSSCDFCGTSIRWECWVAGSDGSEFKVGCDCIRKLEGIDNRLISAAEVAEARRDKLTREAKREMILLREKELIKSAQAKLPSVRSILAKQPHPTVNAVTWSMETYIEWMFRNAGHSGRVRAAKIILSQGGAV